ncbi:MAG: UDP-glucose 4-epimerase [Candidatus Woesearchaeota archaeon]|nr:UDP-glucose 4-epimerase [Candidatus Woesearchaeota archaeon]MDN5327837.1 UDP-glucose 4-epimerase [Candidatus Woesearchaeota archaeon]
MKVLVTGGAGFIGSHLVDKLIEQGFDVYILDNLSTGRKENINKKAKFFFGDIFDDNVLDELFKNNFSYVFHLAAQISVSKSVREPIEDAKTNILGSLKLIKKCIEYKVNKIIFSSTGGAIYGDTDEIPTTEKTLPKPISPYGIAKFSVENYLRFANHEFNLDYTVLRYSNVYGPRQNPEGEAGVIAIFSSRMLKDKEVTIFGDGGYIRDYVFVIDVVNANLKAMKLGNKEVFNISTARGTSVNQLFQMLKELTQYNKKPNYAKERKGDIRTSILSYEKAKRELDWHPEVRLEEGLKKTVEWFKENRI